MTMGNWVSCIIALAMIVLASTGAAKGAYYGGASEDFSDLISLYSPGSGNFSSLEPGDTYTFTDMVSYSRFNQSSGNTEIWFESTGSAPSSYRIALLGEEVSLTFKEGAKGRFDVTVVPTKTPGGEWIECSLDAAVVIKKAPSGIADGNSIRVLGVRIGLDFLPESLQVPLIRSMVVFFAWMIFTLVLWWATILIIKLADRTKIKLNTSMIKILRVPFFTIVLIYGLLLCIALLEPPDGLMTGLNKIYEIAVIVLVSIILVKFFKNVLFVYLAFLARKTQNKADDILIPILNKVVAVVIWVAAGILMLGRFGIDVSVFIAGLGIAGLVIAFAAQDTLSNFFSGIILLIDRPFKEGDWIQLDEKIYQVREIGLRSTRLFHSFTNQVVTIPNNRISDHMFSNLNEPDTLGRTTITVGVDYGSDPSRIGQILVEEVRTHPEVLEDADHISMYRFIDYGESALKFTVTFWVKDFNEQWRIASELRERIFYRFAREGVTIPYPHRVVHMVKDPAGI